MSYAHVACAQNKSNVYGFAILLPILLLFGSALDMQLRFHQQQPSVSTYPAERCRRELHITAIAVSILHIAYFSMVLGGQLLLSVAVLGAVQIPISISAAILVSRMWIYT